MRAALHLAVLGCLVPSLAACQAPADEGLFDSGGVSIRYMDLGSGDPVLLIHGFGGRLETWEAYGVTRALNEAGFRVIAYDVRGHGESGRPHDPEEYGAEDVEDARRLLDHLGIGQAHVVGYSRGGGILSRLVAQYPNRVRRAAFGGWGTGNPIDMLSRPDCLATAELLRSESFPVPLVQALQPPGAPLPSPEEQESFVRGLAEGNDLRALAAAFEAGCDVAPMTPSALEGTSVPMVAIVGEDDGFVQSVEAMVNAMDGSIGMHVIEGANHFSAPYDPEFSARVVAFLTGDHR